VDLVANARAIAPEIAKYALETEKGRRCADASVALLEGAGLFDVLKPKLYGGHQAPLRTMLDVSTEIGKACGGAAWITTLYGACMWLSSLLPKKGQDELHKIPNLKVAGVLTPGGKATRVDGGYRMTGRWGFASGSPHADWLLLGAAMLDKAGEFQDHILCWVPKSEVTMLDDWYVTSLSGSGSNGVTVEDVFIPDHLHYSVIKAIEGDYASTHFKDEALYNSAYVPLLALILTGPAMGFALGAVEEFKRRTPGKPIAYTDYADTSHAAVTHLALGEAVQRIDAGRLMAARACEDVDGIAATGEYMDRFLRSRVRADSGYAMQLMREGVDMLYHAGGGSVLSERNPIQRYWRDIHGASQHGVLAPATNLETYGRTLFGLPENTPLI
jgi:alkylation response protein AidB-like acyl-CoA dehydrogenase